MRAIRLFTVNEDAVWRVDYSYPSQTERKYKPTVHTLDEKVYKKLLDAHHINEKDLEEEKKDHIKEGNFNCIATLDHDMYALRPNGEGTYEIFDVEIYPYHKKRQVTVNWQTETMTETQKKKHMREVEKRKYSTYEETDEKVKKARMAEIAGSEIPKMNARIIDLENELQEEQKKKKEILEEVKEMRLEAKEREKTVRQKLVQSRSECNDLHNKYGQLEEKYKKLEMALKKEMSKDSTLNGITDVTKQEKERRNELSAELPHEMDSNQ